MKIAVVTGASSGLGKAIAAELQRKGYTVAAVCRRDPGFCDDFIAADFSDPASRDAGVAELKKRYPHIDILVNNAGIGSYATWEELSEEELRREFEIDFFAPVAITRGLLDELAGGCVVNISSAAALVPVACMGAYCAVKSALRAFSQTLKMELAGRNIHILNVCPGRIDTGFSSRAVGGRKPPETPGRTASNAETFARKVCNAAERRRRELVYPYWYRFAGIFARMFPAVTESANRKIWKL
ncbi:MAG: SDR family NAD(P)-dependent oxidoreductase [Lentisphaeria bacterium]|nr:SDR family NAD(P)-dependent oxidoreductase [Lentisphaeria bacterium]